MFFKINKCIFIGVRMKAFTIQSKKKIGAWAHMRPPQNLTVKGTYFYNIYIKLECLLVTMNNHLSMDSHLSEETSRENLGLKPGPTKSVLCSHRNLLILKFRIWEVEIFD